MVALVFYCRCICAASNSLKNVTLSPRFSCITYHVLIGIHFLGPCCPFEYSFRIILEYAWFRAMIITEENLTSLWPQYFWPCIISSQLSFVHGVAFLYSIHVRVSISIETAQCSNILYSRRYFTAASCISVRYHLLTGFVFYGTAYYLTSMFCKVLAHK